jgi:FkbM family methyltransferase
VSIRSVLKRTGSACIRASSYVIPGSILFSCLVELRRADNFLRRHGSPSLMRKAIDHFYYSLRPALIETQLDGLRFHMRLNDPFHYDLVLGEHERDIQNWLRENVKEGMVVIDVGANVGSYALSLARLVGPTGRVVAIEADPDIASVLVANMRENNFSQATVVQGAAYRQTGTVRLGRATASTSYSGLYNQGATEWVDVPAFTLDSVVQKEGLTRLDLVKIDAEGAEDDVIDGMSDLLATLRPEILVELHEWHGPTAKIPSKLESAGYRIEMLSSIHALARPR